MYIWKSSSQEKESVAYYYFYSAYENKSQARVPPCLLLSMNNPAQGNPQSKHKNVIDEYRQITGGYAAVSIDQSDRQWPLLSNVVKNCKSEKGKAKSGWKPGSCSNGICKDQA